MRSSILLLPLILSLSVQAQTPFVPIGATWTYTQHYVSGPDTGLFVIECIGDTVIQGRTCSHLAYTEGWNDCMPFLPALTRQGDSVLVFQPVQQVFQTLYVFGQAPGFSWETPVEGADTLTWTVMDTGHVVINDVMLLKQSVTAAAFGPSYVALSSGTVIDRFGDLHYLFPWISGVCDSENNYPLRCYQDSDISWLNPQFPQCALSTGIHEVSNGPAFTISPSPVEANERFTITLQPGATDPHLRILDISGRIVFDHTVNGSATFSLQQAGMYLVQTFGGGVPIAPQRLIVR
jgi:hypothetical protein